MENVLYEYNLHLTTWAYLSSLLVITVFFKFSPLFRIRNLDVLTLVALAPALIMISKPGAETAGFTWLFVWGIVVLLRLLIDPWFKRRPLLEPNLNTGGLLFLGTALLVFLTGHMLSGEPETQTSGPGMVSLADEQPQTEPPQVVADYPLFAAMGAGPTHAAEMAPAVDPPDPSSVPLHARIIALVAQLATVVGLILLGYRHFGNVNTGIAVATLYLLLPVTAMSFQEVESAVPAAFLVWTLVTIRWPLVSGLFLGLATSTIYYPLFLLPLLSGFYYKRGMLRFLAGFTLVVGTFLVLIYTTTGIVPWWQHVQYVFGYSGGATVGIWESVFDSAYRLPIAVTYWVMCAAFALWPVRKNLGTLLSCSTAVMLGAQFWHPFAGPELIGWYLPMLLLTVFRPNLDDQIALFVRGEGWRLRPRMETPEGVQAA